MEYLNPLLLAGLLAAVIPIAIYLFNRSKYKVHKWGAMHLLDAAMTTNRKKVKIEQLLLLLLRTCIPLILALCMARPVITGMKNLVKNSKSSMVIMLDNSYSMESGGSQSSFSKATTESAKIIDNLPRGSQVAVLGMAGPVSESTSGYDLPGSRKVIREAKGGYGMATVEDGIEKSAGLFSERMHHADRQLIIVSDFQKSSWGKGSTTRRRAYELLTSSSVTPRLVLMDVGGEAVDNVAVLSLELSHDVVGVGQIVKIRANLKNYGKQPANGLKVYFRADGESIGISQITLAPDESSQVLFSHKFETPGSHIVEISTDADTLKADNSCHMSIPVLSELPVALINGDPSDQPLKSETAYLNFALKPYAASGSQLKDMIVPSNVDYNNFNPGKLTESRVLIMANVPRLSDNQLKAVEDFVKNGGGLLIFPGDKVDYNWYNNQFLKNGQGIMPMKLGAITSKDKKEDYASIVSQHYEHPAFSLFNDPRNGSLTGAQIKLWYRLMNPEGASENAAVINTIAKLDNGDAFLVEKKFGHGRVILCSTPSDADWSNLPLRPFYLPMMQQLTGYLASTVHPPRNLEIGQAVTAFFPESMAGKPAVLTAPDGSKSELTCVKKGAKSTLEFSKTHQPGVYLLQTPDNKLIHYVVNTTRDESDLERLSDQEIQEMAQEMDAALVKNFEEYRDTDRTRRFGQEIWVLLLWLVLIAAFGELFLIQFFTERKSS